MTKRQIMPGLLGISMFYWAWLLQLWPLGIIFAVLLEAPRWLPWRFQLQEISLIRALKIYFYIIIAVFIVLVIVQLQEGIYTFAQWFPLLAMPIIAVQLYHIEEYFPFQRVIDSIMNRSSYPTSMLPTTLDLRLFYIFITLIAASTAAPHTIWVYLSFAVIVVLSLWHVRPRYSHFFKWINLTALACVLAFFIKGSLTDIQSWVETITSDWLANDWNQVNVFQSYTAMGRIGEIKLSNKIIMRIRASKQRPLLLQQASYSTYRSGSWHMQHLDFEDLTKNEGTGIWRLSESTPSSVQQLSVSTEIKRGQGVLALPKGSVEIQNKRRGILSKNKNGSVRIKESSNLLDYTVYYSEAVEGNSMPGAIDLKIPDIYRKLINNIVSEIKLNQHSPQLAAKKLGDYFEENFRYSLIQSDRRMLSNPLSHFLKRSHKGHCEYFATAGALILRAAGIPARYVTGYAMSEFDSNTQNYVIRQRHAHAWTLAYINNHWVELDFTPSTWAALEAAQDPWWQGIADFFGVKIDDLQRWWEDDTNEVLKVGATIIIIFLLFYYRKKLRFGRLKVNWQRKHSNKPHLIKSQANSPFYKIINHLEQTNDPRKPQETIRNWLLRIDQQFAHYKVKLDPLLKQHYEIVYGEAPTSKQSLNKFAKQVQNWLAQLNNKDPTQRNIIKNI